jgi:hypothetical protein
MNQLVFPPQESTKAATRNICGKIVCSEEDMLSEVDYEIGVKKWFAQHFSKQNKQ